MNIKLAIVPMLAIGLLAGAASALTVGVDGTVTDWNLKPFTQANGSYVNAGVYSTIANDYAPINYPHYGYVPSPGGSRGERFDLEEMHARVVGDRLDVLIVNSGGRYEDGFLLGDLFVQTAAGQFAVITTTSGRSYSVGDAVGITGPADVNLLQNRSGSYLNNNTLVANDYGPAARVRDIAGPWQVVDGLVNQILTIYADVDRAKYSYGGDEDYTHLIEYSIHIPGMSSLAADGVSLHQTWGCGNDVIKLNFTAPPGTSVPTPAAGMAAIGLLGTLAMRRRRTR